MTKTPALFDQIRTMTDEERNAAEICRRCWEHYDDCKCSERKIRRGN